MARKHTSELKVSQVSVYRDDVVIDADTGRWLASDVRLSWRLPKAELREAPQVGSTVSVTWQVIRPRSDS